MALLFQRWVAVTSINAMMAFDVINVGIRGGYLQMNVQFIEQNGFKQYAIVPAETYALLLEKAEMLDDIKAYDEAMTSDEELVPGEVVDRLIAGEHKIKVWREYRGINQVAFAEKVNMAQATIAQIEVDKRIGSVTTLKKIAGALNIDLDDLA